MTGGSDWPVQYPENSLEIDHVYQLPRWVKALLIATSAITLVNGAVVIGVEAQFQNRNAQQARQAVQTTYQQCIARQESAQQSVNFYSGALAKLGPQTDPAIPEILNGALAAAQRGVKVACPTPPS